MFLAVWHKYGINRVELLSDTSTHRKLIKIDWLRSGLVDNATSIFWSKLYTCQAKDLTHKDKFNYVMLLAPNTNRSEEATL